MFDFEEYVAEDGKKPFSIWRDSFKDKLTKARIQVRLDRMETGLFGDSKNLGDGLWELRLDFGPGFRIYYSMVGGKIILLLAGSDKSDQARTIAKAKDFLEDYQRRNK